MARPPGLAPPRPARPALTCWVDGGGARGRRGAQPQPEVQRGPEHARAQQHQPVSHRPPPPAPPRAPTARRAFPRPGGGQGTANGADDVYAAPQGAPPRSTFLGVPSPTAPAPRAAGGGSSVARWLEPRPSTRPPPSAPPSFSLALSAPSPGSPPAPASQPGAEVPVRAQESGAPATPRLKNYISQNHMHLLTSLGGQGGEARGLTLSMRAPFPRLLPEAKPPTAEGRGCWDSRSEASPAGGG